MPPPQLPGTLSLSFGGLRDDNVIPSLEARLENESSLQKHSISRIDLSCNQINVREPHYSLNGFPRCPNLTALNLAANSISSEGCVHICQALERCPQIEVVNFRACQVGDAAAHALSVAVQRCGRLRVLDLSANYLSDAGAIALATAFETAPPSLTTINVKSNDFGQSGVAALQAAARKNRAIQTLSGEGGEQDLFNEVCCVQ